MAPVMTAVVAIWLSLLLCNQAVARAPLNSNRRDSSYIQQTTQHAAVAAVSSRSKAASPAADVSSDPSQPQQHQQRHLSASLKSTAAAAAATLPEITIPQPAPGTDIPAEPLVPLYSPDQLRLRLPPIADVPRDGQIISLMEQMQQADAIQKPLTSEQLQYANPLLGRHGVLKLPDRTLPEHFPEGYVAICAIVKNQHKDLREWIEYHRWLGVARIYIYDNNSTVSGRY
eukprot:GHUV01009903.1.p1 GENE.GHUV01009903.1~~GHUV01009903.1.p1  ORF type:complete len:229 (+),score=47.74 GHUV01009903.1:362-1048(+)